MLLNEHAARNVTLGTCHALQFHLGCGRIRDVHVP